jgi:formylglycine-generating enzyme required for sulfatase activity
MTRVNTWAVAAVGAALLNVALLVAACLAHEPEPVTEPDPQMKAPAGFKAKPGTAAEPGGTGWAKDIVHEKTGMELVFIPAGEFMMGSPDGEKDRERDEGPVHRVRITKGFYLGKYEVTQGEWEKVMGNNPSYFGGNVRFPVEMVSWDDCQEFLRKAGNDLRLPTEAQWEYACRAGTGTRFSFGDDDGSLGDYAWYLANSGSKPHEVGQKKPNAWGLYNMHGNVWEWCSDWHGEKYYGESPADDPQGPAGGESRVLRGGGWGDDPKLCRAANRNRNSPLGRRICDFGLRVLLDLK